MATATALKQNKITICDLAIEVLEDAKAIDIVKIDTSKRSMSLFDSLLICTANSSRHAAAMADRLRIALKKHKYKILGIEGPGDMGWTLIDADEVIIHIFLADTRAHYDLESLWEITSAN